MSKPTRIRARKTGPLVVEGDFELLDTDGEPVPIEGRTKVLLCRCGNSKTAPLCDGSHNRIPATPGRPRRRLGDMRPDPEMWEALEHGRKLERILRDFYDRVFADERLAPFFHGVTKQRAIEKQYSFLMEKFTGDKCYFGDRPRNAHHWMVISEELFDYREELMEQCVRRAGLPEHLVERWRALEEVFRKQIVKDRPFGRKIRGEELPFEGYEVLEMSLDFVCDGCTEEVVAGQQVHYHRRTGRTYCKVCVPDPDLRHDIGGPVEPADVRP